MGDIADMMIDGDLCESCGVYMGNPGQGFPRRCASCEKDHAEFVRQPAAAPNESKNMSCPTCGKRVRRIGLEQHVRDKHRGSPNTSSGEPT